MDSGTLTPVLKKLEHKGYLSRTRSKEDERSLLVTISAMGEALKEKAKDVPACVARCIDLPPEKAQTLYALLYELLYNQKKKTEKE